MNDLRDANAVEPTASPAKFCIECGGPISEGDVFCMNCGHKVYTGPDVPAEEKADDEGPVIEESADLDSALDEPADQSPSSELPKYPTPIPAYAAPVAASSLPKSSVVSEPDVPAAPKVAPQTPVRPIPAAKPLATPIPAPAPVAPTPASVVSVAPAPVVEAPMIAPQVQDDEYLDASHDIDFEQQVVDAAPKRRGDDLSAAELMELW